ncbi:MAG: glycosyltransferase family 39 protein [Kofleriaceae bacterium]
MVIGAICLVVFLGLALIARPLGHDESVYALGSDFDPMRIHRPVGMHVLAALGALPGHPELGFRIVAALGTTAFVIASWCYARRAFDTTVATWTAAVVGGSFALLHRSSELLSDAPAGALILVVAMLLSEGLAHRDRQPAVHWKLAAIGPATAAAFYLRYGSIIIVAALGAAAAVAFRRQLWAQRGPLLAAIASMLVLAIPHVIHSVGATGSPLGIIKAGGAMAGRPLQGVVFYSTTWWYWLLPAAAVCVASGCIAAVIRPFRDRRSREIVLFTGLGAALALAVLGIVAHGEARYAYVPQALLTSSGIAMLRALHRGRAGERDRGWLRGVVIVVVAATAVGGVAGAVWTLVRAGERLASIADAGELIRADAAGRPCKVASSRWAQVGWYSGCEPLDSELGVAPDAIDGVSYLVWFDRAPRQWTAVLDRLRMGADGVKATEWRRVEHGRDRGATLYRLSRVR